MAKNTREIFSTDSTHSYAWAVATDHPQLTGQTIQTDEQTVDEGTIFITGTDEIGSNILTITAQLRMSPNGVTEVWGVEHDLLDKSSTPVNTLTANTNPVKFEANLFEQSWWSPNHAVRILISRATDRAVTLVNYAIVK